MSKRLKNKRASDNRKTVVVNKATATVHEAKVVGRAHDGFANLVSRTGVRPGGENQLSSSYYEFNYITRNRIGLEAAYRGSWVVGKLIDSIAEDMTKAGVDITMSSRPQEVELLKVELSRLGIWDSLCDVIKWARLYGGGIGVLQLEGQDTSSPLLLDRIGKGQFKGIAVYDRWQVIPDLTKVIPSGPDMGLPAYYTIVTDNNLLEEATQASTEGRMTTGLRVHHSRVVRQIGIKLPYFQTIIEQMWGESEIERIFDRLVSFDNATMSSANLINQANLRGVKVDGLREILSVGGKAEEGLLKMFDYVRMFQSNEGLTLLDGNDELSSMQYTFAGLSDMMLQFGQQLSGASGIPLVRMFGQSPAGLNSTGESDLKNYYGDINAKQESRLRHSVEKILRVAYKSKFGRPAPDDMQFKFTSLWQPSETEKATIAQTKSQTVVGVFEAGVIKRSTTLKELRQQSSETGVFTNITDEDIAEAEEEDKNEPPMPGEEDPGEAKPIKVKSSLKDKIKKALGV